MRIIQGSLHEKQTHPHHADDGADDLAYRHFLVEQDGRWGDDEDGREREDGLRDACGGVHRGQQRRADPDERPEDGGGEHASHRLAVADGATQLRQAVLAEQHQREEEARQPDVGADGGGGEGHADADRQRQQRAFKDRILGNVERRERRFVVLESHLAEYQSETLTDTGHRRVEDALGGQFEMQSVMLRIIVFRENRQGDAAQGDHHPEDGNRAHLFAKKDSSREGCRGGRKGHKELPEARPDVDVTLHQAVVADDVADHSRQQQPAPRAAVGVARVRHAHNQPEGEDEKAQRHRHPDRVERQRTHSLRAHLREKRGGGPGKGNEQGNQLTEEHG